MSRLRTVDPGNNPDRAQEIADRAAYYVISVRAFGADLDSLVHEDRAYANGCPRDEAARRLYVIRRACRIAQQHLDGDEFQMVCDAIEREEVEALS